MNWLDQFLAAHPSVGALISFVSAFTVIWCCRHRRREPTIINTTGRVDAPNSELGFDPTNIDREKRDPEFVPLRDLALQWGWQPGDAEQLAAAVLRRGRKASREDDLRAVIARRLDGRKH